MQTRVYSKYLGTSLSKDEVLPLYFHPTRILLSGAIVDENSSTYMVEIKYLEEDPPPWLRGIEMFTTVTLPKERVHKLIG